jgi:hypothetical protein
VVTDSSGVADAPADAELATPCPHSDKLAPTTTADTAATNLRDMALALLTLRVPHTALDVDEAAKREYSCRPRKEVEVVHTARQRSMDLILCLWTGSGNT